MPLNHLFASRKCPQLTKMAKFLRWAKLPEREDVYTWEGTTRWGNHDLYPIPWKERNYGILAYYSYFVISGVSITGFTAGSAYISAGLSVSATCGAILLGNIIAGGNSYLGGQAGVDKSLGYVSFPGFKVLIFLSYRKETKRKEKREDVN